MIRALLKRGTPDGAGKRRGWVDGLHAIHRRLLAKEWDATTDGVNFAAIVCEVDKHLSDDATVTTDAGNFGSFVHRYIGFRQSQIFLSSVVGAMGSGMPMAVAAALRRPGKQVVAFLGDGGTLMMGNEIATACQYGVNPIVVISDNGMYGTIGMHSYVRYPERPFMDGTRLTNPDFAAWARSFGAEGITIRDEAEVKDGIARAFAVKTRPVVVHCLTSAIQMKRLAPLHPDGDAALMRIALIHALEALDRADRGKRSRGCGRRRGSANLLDDSLSADLARDGVLTPAMTVRFPHPGALRQGQRRRRHPVHLGSAFGPCIEACARELAPMQELKPNEAMIEDALALVGPSGWIGLLATFAPTLDSMPPEFTIRSLPESLSSPSLRGARWPRSIAATRRRMIGQRSMRRWHCGRVT